MNNKVITRRNFLINAPTYTHLTAVTLKTIRNGAVVWVLSKIMGCSGIEITRNLSILDSGYIQNASQKEAAKILKEFKDPVLAYRVGTINEMQGQITPQKIQALEQLLYDTKKYQKLFRSAGEWMAQEGDIPCNMPTRSVFWMYEDGKQSEIKEALSNMQKLADKSWDLKQRDLEFEIIDLPQEQIVQVIDKFIGLNRAPYTYINPKKYREKLVIELEHEPENFPPKILELLNRAKKTVFDEYAAINNERWKDLNTAIQNTPTTNIWRIWAQKYLRYPGSRDPVRSVHSTYKNKKGDCDDVLRLGIHMRKPHGSRIIPISQYNHKHFVGVEVVGEYCYDVINWVRNGLTPMRKLKKPSDFGEIVYWNSQRSQYR